METILFLQDHFAIYICIVAFLGLVIGSFLNVVILRLPKMLERDWRKECHEFLELTFTPEKPEKFDLISPRSHCPHCQKKLRPWHNIPVLSFVLLRGKCSDCQKKISWRYPFVEVLTCLASIAVAWHFGVTWQSLGGLFFTWIIIALIFIDLDTQLLPDQLTFTLLWLGLFFSLFSLFCNPQDAILGAIFGYLVFAITAWLFHKVTGKIGMGNGDFKFLAALGAFLGWQMLPLIILFASVGGVVVGLLQMCLRGSFKSVPLPFGPYLAIAGWIALIKGSAIVQFYLAWAFQLT